MKTSTYAGKMARTRILAVTAGACLLLAGSSVWATAVVTNPSTVTVFAADDVFTVDYECASGATSAICGNDPNGNNSGIDVTAESIWSVISVSGTQVVFEIALGNTTSDPDSTTNRITQFGVKILSPGATSVIVNSTSGIWTADLNVNFPTFQTVALLVDDPQKNGKSGIFEAGTDAITLTLNLASFNSTNGLQLQIFPIKFQGVGSGDISLEFAGSVTVDDEIPGVPAPAPLALVGLGAVLLGLTRRRFAY